MALVVGWLEGEDQIQALLRESHRARHNAGREETRLRTAEIERLKRAGDEKRAQALDEREWKRGIAFARRKRQLEELEARKGGRRFSAVIPEDERVREVGKCPASLFKQFEAKKRSSDSGLRDLYYDVISRGLHSGRAKDYKKYLKRSSSRTTPWKSGEMGRKVRYIVRDDALENVEGNVITNMGETIEEAIACTRVIEQIEQMNRDNAGVYKHVIIGLPHQLSAEARAELLAEMTKPLREMGLPFVASLHKPDAKGDQRNFHAHIVVSLRPMERLGDHHWEFDAGKRSWLDTPAAIRLQRRYVAGAFNQALASADETVRWTGKSRAARGEKCPGNNKRSQEGNRAQRQEEEVEGALSSALNNVAAIEELDHDLASLDSVFEDLAKVVSRFDHIAGKALAEISALRAVAAEQVSAIEVLSDVHEGIRRGFANIGSDAERVIDVEAPRFRALPDGSHEAEAGRGRQKTSAPEQQPSTSTEGVPNHDMAIDTDGFAELRRFELENDQKQRPAIRLRKLKTLTSEIALADAAAYFEIEQQGGRIDGQAFERVRKALLSQPPILTAEPADGGNFRLYARSKRLLEDVATIWQTDAGNMYLGLVLDEAPLAPPEKSEMWSIWLKLQDLTNTPTNIQQATQSKSRKQISTSAVGEEEIPLDVQVAFLSGRGGYRTGGRG